MHVKHAVLLKLKHAALFLIMLRVDLAHKITPDNFPATKKTTPIFLTQLVCIIFLSAFSDIMQTENNGFG